MKLTSTLALCFAASALWNCNDSATRPESASNDPRVPVAVNAVAKYAAVSAGYQVSSEARMSMPDKGNPFGEDALNALRDAGLCENFVLLFQELFTTEESGMGNPQSGNPLEASPRLKRVVSCLEDKGGAFGSTVPSENQILDIVETCFCGGSGTLFFRNFAFTTYAAPGSPARSPYAAPTVNPTPYSKPTLPGYSAPASPGGSGYSAPSL